eukprot:jgi/Mesen1/3140/ME000184S02209
MTALVTYVAKAADKYTYEQQRQSAEEIFFEEMQYEDLFDPRDENRPARKWTQPSFQRKTKIVCTIGPTSGDLPSPIFLEKGDPFTFTIKRGVSTETMVSVNYDGFIGDVDVGDSILIDGGMMSLLVKEVNGQEVHCTVLDGGELKSRRHLNVRGKNSPGRLQLLRCTLTCVRVWVGVVGMGVGGGESAEKDWEDIKFGVEQGVDFYALSFVKDAEVVHELKDFLRSQQADINVIVKIESADSIPNLHSILDASDGLLLWAWALAICAMDEVTSWQGRVVAMVARGDLGAELPVEEVPLLQDTGCASASMMALPGSKPLYPLKAVRVMHTVAMRTEATMPDTPPANLGRAFKNHMSEMFAFHATIMANTLGASILVFTRSGFMATLLSHYRPLGTTFAFTNDKRVQQRLALYHGVRALYLPFTSDAEQTFTEALEVLKVGAASPPSRYPPPLSWSSPWLACTTQKRGLVKNGEDVALVQSGRQPIWRSESTHHIQVRTVR